MLNIAYSLTFKSAEMPFTDIIIIHSLHAILSLSDSFPLLQLQKSICLIYGSWTFNLWNSSDWLEGFVLGHIFWDSCQLLMILEVKDCSVPTSPYVFLMLSSYPQHGQIQHSLEDQHGQSPKQRSSEIPWSARDILRRAYFLFIILVFH